MRTTIEIKSKHRARLMEIAATRGEKGFSGVVEEALEHYFDQIDRSERAIARALELKGCLGESEGAELRERTQQIRDAWR